MFQRAFSALPTDVAAQAINIVDKAPEDNSYDTLKRTVISCLFGSQKKTCSQNYEQEDRTPSVTCDPLWAKSGQMKCLPVNMATCLANNVNRSNLDELPEAESFWQRARVSNNRFPLSTFFVLTTLGIA
ncbi:unnamed protein product [Hymenolepis diminuta]|uniref:IncF plasmid conjugative transfer protein TraN n=1 Tax=Hymenolepis diminuta TaxID=6216 RepID=A0A0R3SCE5_HYMDI|nr:unnamed protein product [Hymenolepis diminuta]